MSELANFHKLKEDLLRKFCEENPHWEKGLAGFGMREISRFQEMLQKKTGGRVSEKWFYTHLKKNHHKLPRVDVLDLLSQFVGYGGWGEFQSSVTIIQSANPQDTEVGTRKKRRGRIGVFIAGAALAIFTLMLALSNIGFGETKKYETCFVDALTRQPLESAGLAVQYFPKNESPINEILEKNNCHVFSVRGNEIVFTVKANYYHSDTITRKLTNGYKKETIPLRRDDYAWMIHLFSSGNIKDLKKRRRQLGKMIADEAMIFQVDAESGTGMELFNKGEFIHKMTLPVLSLKNIKVLETEYGKNGRILKLRFVQKK